LPRLKELFLSPQLKIKNNLYKQKNVQVKMVSVNALVRSFMVLIKEMVA
jgi:hypothetical protein